MTRRWYGLYHRAVEKDCAWPVVDGAAFTRPYDVSEWAVARRLCIVMGWPWRPPIPKLRRGKRISEGGDGRPLA
jgi:hypothetical protein